MPSFQTTISPTRRAAARFVAAVRRALQQALVEEGRKRGLTQSEIARQLKVHRSVINRELRGESDLTLGRIGELAFVLERKPNFVLEEKKANPSSNIAAANLQPIVVITSTTAAIAQPKILDISGNQKLITITQ